jgi:hypothetical protein
MGYRFNPPPNWPAPPPGWFPPPGWQPASEWPVPPPGWQLWIDDGVPAGAAGHVPTPPPVQSRHVAGPAASVSIGADQAVLQALVAAAAPAVPGHGEGDRTASFRGPRRAGPLLAEIAEQTRGEDGEQAFDLNIEKVLEHWTVPFAIRELIANALDEQALTGTAEPAIFSRTPQETGMWPREAAASAMTI